MKTKIIYTNRNTCVELIIDEPVPREERRTLAAMSLFEGTGAWMMTDIRLAKYRAPSRYSGSIMADDVCTGFKPKNKDDAEYIRSRVKVLYEEDGVIYWCPFEGLVPGTPREGEFLETMNHVGYFTKQEGLAKLKEIQQFWDTYEGDPAKAKIPNPNRQPSFSDISAELSFRKMGRDPSELYEKTDPTPGAKKKMKP